MPLVCCRWSCIMCRAFVTRSSGIGSDVHGCNRRIVPSPPGVVPSNDRLPATGRDWRSRCCSWRARGRRVRIRGHLSLRMVSRQRKGAAGRASKDRAACEEGHGGSEGPLRWPRCGQWCGNRHISRFQGVFVSSFFFFSAPFSSPRFFLNCLVSLTMRVLFCWCVSRRSECRREMRCLIHFSLFEGFRAWQHASSTRSSSLVRGRSSLLSTRSGWGKTAKSVPMLLRSSSYLPFRIRGRPRC